MRRLSILQLVPGMTVARDISTFGGDLVLPRGTTLDDKLITKLNLYGIFTVYVEEAIPESAKTPAPREPSYSNRLRQSETFHDFKKRYDLELVSFREVINNLVEKNMPLNVELLLQQALNIAEMGKERGCLLSMLQNMRQYDDSTYSHCINVALLSNILATWLKFDSQQIELATICGLLHDLGKLLVPHPILSKPDKLTDREYEIVQKHTINGYQMLHDQKVDVHIQNAALMHHERSDGSGYPLHYKGQQIDKYARIVAIVDVYDAMTAARVYRGPLCPFRAIEIYESEGFQKYDVEYLLTFLENVVNTYIQNRCLLSDGREGDIVYINKAKLSRPVVQCGTEYINLAECPELYIEALL